MKNNFKFYQSRYTYVEIQLMPYFSTSATSIGIGGQCQEDVLKGLLLNFYLKYNQYHLKQLNQETINDILNDIEILKLFYSEDQFYYKKSFKGQINNNLSVLENYKRNELYKKLSRNLEEKATTKTIKI